jgi:hypothetical protein
VKRRYLAVTLVKQLGKGGLIIAVFPHAQHLPHTCQTKRSGGVRIILKKQSETFGKSPGARPMMAFSISSTVLKKIYFILD